MRRDGRVSRFDCCLMIALFSFLPRLNQSYAKPSKGCELTLTGSGIGGITILFYFIYSRMCRWPINVNVTFICIDQD